MKSQLVLLVVEDRANHLQDFKEMFLGERFPIRIDVLYAADLESALQLLPRADAVITDVFFPDTTGGEEKPNGQIVVERCLAEKKPVVWITSTFHHGPCTNAASEWGRKRGLEMFDCFWTELDEHGEGPHKPWRHALFSLLALAIVIDDGDVIFEGGKFMLREVLEIDGRKFEKLTVMYSFYLKNLCRGTKVAARMAQMGFKF